jgi:hypothetical protein
MALVTFALPTPNSTIVQPGAPRCQTRPTCSALRARPPLSPAPAPAWAKDWPERLSWPVHVSRASPGAERNSTRKPHPPVGCSPSLPISPNPIRSAARPVHAWMRSAAGWTSSSTTPRGRRPELRRRMSLTRRSGALSRSTSRRPSCWRKHSSRVCGGGGRLGHQHHVDHGFSRYRPLSPGGVRGDQGRAGGAHQGMGGAVEPVWHPGQQPGPGRHRDGVHLAGDSPARRSGLDLA